MSEQINIALNKRASQSSNSQWSQAGEASIAVNGIKTGEFSFHTTSEEHAWWQVDLEKVFPLSMILVYNRGVQGSRMADRATSMAIFVSVDGMHWEKLYAGGRPFGGVQDHKPLALDISGISARFVRLQLMEENYFHLDEVEIYTEDVPQGDGTFNAFGAPSLSLLGRKYGTDKVPHGFCDIYESAFSQMRPSVTHMLEIGVFFGASLCMWRDWFPQAMIHGADHFTGQQGNGTFFENAEKFFNEVNAGQHPRIVLHPLDQSKRLDLVRFSDEWQQATFDIVVDDASHLMRDQQQTLGALFSLVKAGGFFVIEDIHSSLCNDYDVEPDGSNSTLRMVELAIAGHGWQSKYMSREEMEFLNQAVDFSGTRIYGAGGSRTCLIRRRE